MPSCVSSSCFSHSSDSLRCNPQGGGGYDIHYGVFTNPTTDTVFTSSKETNTRLLTTLEWFRSFANPQECRILDLGSGHGGLSHEAAARFHCPVVGCNISPQQNTMNLQQAQELGLSDLVSVHLLNFNHGLPADWTGTFSHVLSCEVLCHAANKEALLGELFRVLKPGGALVFTDIMGADDADEKVLQDFTDRNATTQMARPAQYLQQLRTAGFENVSFNDFSYPHLELYFGCMLDQIHKHKEEMMADGVPEAYLDKWIESLTSRVEIQKNHGVFAWGIFTARVEGPVY